MESGFIDKLKCLEEENLIQFISFLEQLALKQETQDIVQPQIVTLERVEKKVQ